MQTLWEKTLELLRSEVNEPTFAAWFQPIREVSVDDVSITLGVPNKFFENWIREKYISLIKAGVQQVSGKNLSIAFTSLDSSLNNASTENVVPDLAPQQEKERVNWLKSVFSSPRQVPESRYREIGLNSNYTFENFVVGQSNRFAHAAAQAICEKPAKVYNPLFLYGGVGLGKTHLMQAIGHNVFKNSPKTKLLYITSEEFTNQLITAIRTKATQKFRAQYRNVDVLLIDDIQFIAGKEATQEEFFHTFNALYDAHKQIVLSSDRPPQDIQRLEERLTSRFAWGLIADIQPPDFETRAAILEKKGELSSVKVPREALLFLAENIKTNIREMEGALIRIVAYAKLTGMEITPSFAREVLKGMISEEDKKVTIGEIQKIVANYFNMEEADMKAKKRARSVVYPRQVAMYLSRSLTHYSLPDIGGFFGGRDHTTVLHACEKISKEIIKNEKTKIVVDKLANLIKQG